MAHGVFTPDADIYYINASLTEVADPVEAARLMNIPTNLALTDDEVENLLLAGSHLLRQDPEFQRLVRDLEQEATTSLEPSIHSQEQ